MIQQDKKQSQNKNIKEKKLSEDEFEQKVIDLARVTRVTAGGKRMRFRACMAIGNRKGKIAIGLAKGSDVATAISKAVDRAKKEIITVPIINDTIFCRVYKKLGSAKVLIKPAAQGKGIKAGGVVRLLLDLSGIPNVSAKILGTNNKINNAQCTIAALKELIILSEDIKDNKKDKSNVARSKD